MPLDMQPDSFQPDHDDEGRMAKADLYKIAKYSLKMFKMIEPESQLEGWVQAKITKAADYIASVYHYMEYEMKFSEYGEKLETADIYSESEKKVLMNKLFEAKEKLKKLKTLQAEKIKNKDVKEATGFRATGKKKGKVEKSEKKKYFAKMEKDDRTRGVTTVADEGESESDVRDRIKRENRGWSLVSLRLADSGSGENVDEGKKGAKPDFLDMDKDGDKKEPMKKAVADKKKKPVEEAEDKCNHSPKGKSCPIHGMKECKMTEESKPSAGMTKSEKSAVVKKAKAGGDIGKPGKGFEKVEKAAKKGGAKDPKAVAAAAMWKQQAKK
jgi:hypothetical protein